MLYHLLAPLARQHIFFNLFNYITFRAAGGTVTALLLWARRDSRYVMVAVVATLWMGMIGFLDDYLKIVRGQSQGLVARWKLVGQIAFGVGLGLYLYLFPLTNSVQPNATQLPLF